MSWYWWLFIFIYMNGASFTIGASLDQSRGELPQTILLVILWPIALFGVLYELFHERYLDENKIWLILKTKFAKMKKWKQNRKEDQIFNEKHLDNKFERLGLKFDDNDDVWRSNGE